MKIRMFLTAMALATAGMAGSVAAQTGTVCRMQNGSTQPANAQTIAPLIVTGQGQSSNQNTASSKAIQDWGSRVGGWQWAYWNKAARKSSNCTSANNSGFKWIHTCRVTAQPCM